MQSDDMNSSGNPRASGTPYHVSESQGRPSGQPIRAVLTWSLAALLIVTTFLMQRPDKPSAEVVAKAVSGLSVPPVAAHQRLLVKLGLAGAAQTGQAGGTGGGNGGSGGGMPAQNFGGSFVQPMLDESVGFTLPERGMFDPPPSANDPVSLEEPDRDQASAADRVRVAMFAGSTHGPAAALKRLDLVEPLLDPASELVSDVRNLRAYFEHRAAEATANEDASTAIDSASVRELLDRHGLFAAAALHEADPEAKRMWLDGASDGETIMMLMVLMSLLILGVLLTGLVLWIIGLVGLSQGWVRLRMREWIRADELTDGDRLVWVETLVVFLAMFAGLKLALGALHATGVSDSTVSTAALFGQWLVLPSIFWPLVRGVRWERWKTHMGWSTSPRESAGDGGAFVPPGAPKPKRGSVIREIGAGLLGHCAWLFAYVCFALVWVLLYTIVSKALGMRAPSGIEDNKMLDLFGSGGLFEVIMLVLLASIWAPIVEETIFRGVLFRHWRPRIGFLGSALATAAIFAALHAYGPMQLVLVAMLGVGFALIREWRGSIIGCMAAHALHNFTVTVIMIMLLHVLA